MSMDPAERRAQAREAGHAATRAGLVEGPEAARRRALRILDEQLRRIPAADRAPVACAAGCVFCCHLRVMATPAEVFGLLDYLRQSLDADAFAAFEARVAAAAERIAGLDREQLLATNLACPVLVDGRCAGYPARPFNCRAYHSLDRSACERSFAEPSDPTLGHPQYTQVTRANEGLQSGFIAGLGEAGYDNRQVELVGALAEALADPEARRRFLARGPAFLRESPRL